MDSVGYLSPFVPPEWIAAHGLRPAWLAPDRQAASVPAGTHRGLCPCAGALIAAAHHDAPAALVLTTACDQMRYASAYLEAAESVPVFLLNVPSTWRSAPSRRFYREELERLGRFLCTLGGRKPTSEQLRATVERFDDRRAAALAARDSVSAVEWTALRSELPGTVGNLPSPFGRGVGGEGLCDRSKIEARPWADYPHPNPLPEGEGTYARDGTPLALLGGPLMAGDEVLLLAVARAGGRIVLDGSEGGERTLPAPIDRKRLAADPLDELVRAYFDTIPDVFRRPNTKLYEWLGKHLPARSVRGILFRRNLFCDLWHAELHRLRAWSDLPVLELDAAAGDEGEMNRAVGRIEAFLETVNAP